MLSKPTQAAQRALKILSDQPLWRQLEEMLETELVAAHERLETETSHIDIARLQGRARMLKDFKDLVHKSRALPA